MCNHPQGIHWMNKEIFAMLDDIRIANKENPLLKSSNMAAMT